MKYFSLIALLLINLYHSVKNPYKVLGISKFSTLKEAKKAYKKLVKEGHPDKFQNDPNLAQIKEKMKEINVAYEMIKNGYNNDSQEEFNNNTNQELNFIDKIIEIIKITAIAYVVHRIIYQGIKFMETIYSFLFGILSISYVTYNVLNTFFIHSFDDVKGDEMKYASSLVSGVVLTSLYTLLVSIIK